MRILRGSCKDLSDNQVDNLGKDPSRIFEDLQKIFEDEDLSRILKGSLKDL